MSGQRAGQALRGISTEDVERVEAAIRDRVGSRVSEVRATVRGGGLVLQGRSRTHHAKQLAQQAAVEFADWPILVNEIQVCGGDAGGGDGGADVKAADKSTGHVPTVLFDSLRPRRIVEFRPDGEGSDPRGDLIRNGGPAYRFARTPGAGRSLGPGCPPRSLRTCDGREFTTHRRGRRDHSPPEEPMATVATETRFPERLRRGPLDRRGDAPRPGRAAPDRRLLAGQPLPVPRDDLPEGQPAAPRAAQARAHQGPAARPLGLRAPA